MKIVKKCSVLLLMVAAFMLICSVPSLCVEQENQDLLMEKLKIDEVEKVKQEVDKALRKAKISNAYGFTSEEILNNSLKGKPLQSLEGIPKFLLNVLGKEAKANIALVIQMFAIMLLGAIIYALQPLEGGLPNAATKYAINGVLVIIVAISYGSMVDVARATIDSISQVSSIAMPAMLALMASSGRIVSVSAIQPIMLIIVNGATQLLKNVLLPITVMAGVLFLVDSISERFKLKTLAKLLKSFSIWATGVITLGFSMIISLQKIASSSVDAIALKTTKFAIGTFIPVAGRYMADAADTILTLTSVASNFVGILTVIGLAIVTATPFIKIFVVMIAFRLTAALGAPICDEAICDALENSAECLSVMIGIMGATLFTNILLTGSLMHAGGILN